MDQFASNYNTPAGGEAEVINLSTDSEYESDTESARSTMVLTDSDESSTVEDGVVRNTPEKDAPNSAVVQERPSVIVWRSFSGTGSDESLRAGAVDEVICITPEKDATNSAAVQERPSVIVCNVTNCVNCITATVRSPPRPDQEEEEEEEEEEEIPGVCQPRPGDRVCNTPKVADYSPVSDYEERVDESRVSANLTSTMRSVLFNDNAVSFFDDRVQNDEFEHVATNGGVNFLNVEDPVDLFELETLVDRTFRCDFIQ
ncbi:uncharacterized protein LOC118805905 [Colossoma macropomum]|uniref:uncharacterized protein LOC118805905 n=1 Tax=Colossoma macropomum TaxID=42526 RepID=UPI0018649FF9|nr:uncharacterized protein LOC118805905 [Colossoma macropomum]